MRSSNESERSDGSWNAATISRTTISQQTCRESSGKSSSRSQYYLVTDNNDKETGPGSDRSSILVATVLSCDGLTMTEHTLYLTRMCLKKVMSSNDITGRVLHVIVHELLVNNQNESPEFPSLWNCFFYTAGTCRNILKSLTPQKSITKDITPFTQKQGTKNL